MQLHYPIASCNCTISSTTKYIIYYYYRSSSRYICNCIVQLHHAIASCNCICKNYVKQKQVNKSLTNECNFLSFIINDLRLNDKNNCKNVWLFEIFVVTLPLSIETITAVMRVFKIKY